VSLLALICPTSTTLCKALWTSMRAPYGSGQENILRTFSCYTAYIEI
jgi:hypothetical protein